VKAENKNFKFSTGQKIQSDDWNFKDRLPMTKRGAAGIKTKHISTILSQYSNLLDELIAECEKKNVKPTLSFFKDNFNDKFKNVRKVKSVFVSDVIGEFIEIKNLSGAQSKVWNGKYKNLKGKIEAFQESKNIKIQFSNIDMDMIDEYCGFLRTIKHKIFKPHNDNTLHRNINFLITFLIWSNGKYHNLDLTKIKNPVKKYQPEDVHLTTEEIDILEKIVLKSESLERVRDLFLIGIYSGQRFSDYSKFEKADLQGDMIIKRAEKTEHESFIPMHPKLERLLEKYEWKLPIISGQRFNEYIQKICLNAGFTQEIKETVYRGSKKEVLYHPKYKMITSHSARRTFITLSSERGMPDHVIMKITGIRDPATLLKYKKTSQQSVIDQMNKYWN
jgi:integrase